MPELARLPQSDDPIEDLSQLVMSLRPDQLRAFTLTCDSAQASLIEYVLSRKAGGEAWRDTPDAMAAALTKGAFIRFRYTRLIGQVFKDAILGAFPRVLLSMPARLGKTRLCEIEGPTWALDLMPWLQIVIASYHMDLSRESAVAIRDNANEHGDVLRFRLKQDAKRADRFKTVQGGGVLAASVGSRLTGFGADVAVLGDLFSGWEAAHSEAERKRVINWYLAVVFLRLQGPRVQVHAATRWNEDDLQGYLIKAQAEGGETWRVIRLPAIAERHDPNSDDPLLRSPDPLGREPGEVIEPLRMSVEQVQTRAHVLGAYLAAAMEQQRPAPEEGGEIRRGWWRYYTDELPQKFDATVTSWDMKLKDRNDAGDYVAGQAWGRVASSFWLLDQIHGQLGFPETKVAVVLLGVRNPEIKTHVIEAAGNGPEVKAELSRATPGYVVSDDIASRLGMSRTEREQVEAVMRRGMSGIVMNPVKTDKVLRLRAQSGKIEGGYVWLPKGKSFTIALVNEAAQFPNGDHDDQVDALSQALMRLDTAGQPVRTRSAAGRSV